MATTSAPMMMRPILLLLFICVAADRVSGQLPAPSKALAKLTRDMNQLKHLSAKVYNEFERVKPHQGPFGKVVSDIRQHKHRLRQLSSQMHTAFASLSPLSFIERLVLQFHRIQCEKLGEIFDHIVLEIVGHQVGISDYSNMHFSESIEIANNVAHYKFVQLGNSANETNRLIVGALGRGSQTNATSSKVSREVRCKIDRQLDDLVRDTDEARSELAKHYLGEVAKFIELKREMNLVQKMQVEKFLDALQVMSQFIRAYQRALRRLLKC